MKEISLDSGRLSEIMDVCNLMQIIFAADYMTFCCRHCAIALVSCHALKLELHDAIANAVLVVSELRHAIVKLNAKCGIRYMLKKFQSD